MTMWLHAAIVASALSMASGAKPPPKVKGSPPKVSRQIAIAIEIAIAIAIAKFIPLAYHSHARVFLAFLSFHLIVDSWFEKEIE
jgi:hypothetical protein